MGSVAKDLYPFWKEVIIEFENRGCNELILTGALGTGKSYAALTLLLRRAYILSCYKSIPSFLSLAADSMVLFFYLSLSVPQAMLTGFGKLIRMIDSAPYFIQNFSRNTAKDSVLEFKGRGLTMGCGSDISHFRGGDLFALVFDEGNFRRGGDRTKFQKAVDIYTESLHRRTSRFLIGDKDMSLSVIASSVDTLSSFTQARIDEARSDSSVMVVNATTWDTKPARFSGVKFPVYKGSERFEPFLIDDEQSLGSYLDDMGIKKSEFDVKNLSEDEREKWVDVPIEFKTIFKQNSLPRVLADMAGVPIGSSSKYFSDERAYFKCFPLGTEDQHPFTKQEVCVSFKQAIRLEHFLKEGFRFDPKFQYNIHIDQSLTTDCTGFAVTHNETGVIVVDMMLRIPPPPKPDQVSIRKVREFFLWCRRFRGLRISNVTYDQFACLSGDSTVLTREGYTLLKEVLAGAQVWSGAEWNRVLKVFKYPGVWGLKVVTCNATELKGTKNHRIQVLDRWVWDKKRRLPIWKDVELQELKEGDIVRTSEKLRINYDNDRELVSIKEAEFLGLLHGDGVLSIKDDKWFSVKICCGTESEALQAHSLIEEVFGRVPPFRSKVEGRTEWDICIGDTPFLSKFLDLGLLKGDAKGKKVPDFILRSSAPVIAGYLRGLFAADGSVCGNVRNAGQVSLTSVSFDTVFQVKVILSDLFGLSSSISKVDMSKHPSTKGNGLCYYLRVNGSRSTFLNRVGFLYKEKQEKLAEFSQIPGRVTYSRVKKIEAVFLEEVFDLQVENDPHYVVNSIVSHNSAEAIQEFQNLGVKCGRLSVDRDAQQYDALIDRIFTGAIKGYHYPPFYKEILDLEKDVIKNKVDHPITGSKDVADGVAGSCWHSITTVKRIAGPVLR